ncbi:MAG: 50S ribosomal protein L10 [Candidatus Berkelbacteria bacterium]|nr:50S ribosomal protein L10 [Candidatus Berkelbacteria bacterium]
MPKTREQKEQLLKSYEESLKKVKSIILTKFSGLKTKNLFELKDELLKKGINYKVIKNRIFNLALKGKKIEIPSEILDEPLALAFSIEDEIEPAKIIYNFTKENDKLEILGALTDGKFVTPDKIKALALLPGRQELYARLIRAINAPRYRLLNSLTYNPRVLINILHSQINK